MSLPCRLLDDDMAPDGGVGGDVAVVVPPADADVVDDAALLVVVVALLAVALGAQPLGVWLRRVMRGDEFGLGLSEARDRIMLLLSACSDEVAMLKSSQPMSCMELEGWRWSTQGNPIKERN